MRDRRAQPAGGGEDAGGFGHRLRHPVHVVQAHVRHDQVERPVSEGQGGRVGEHGRRGIRVPGRQPDHGRRGVGPGHPVAGRAQVPGYPSLATAQVERGPGRLGQQVPQRGQVDVVVRVV
jgi:hypothetical protein